MHGQTRYRISAAAAVIVTLSLSACFGGARDDSGGTDSNAISMWMFAQGDDEAAIYAIEEAFEAANDGKDLEIVVYPEEEYVTKVNTSLVAGNPPDVAIIESDDWMKAGYVVELTDKLADWGVSIDDYNPGGLSRGALENDPANGVYGIGTFLGGNVLVYNKAMFDEAGVPYPSAEESMTFAEYADVCRELAQPNEDPTQTVYGCTMPSDIAFGFYPIHGEDGRTAVGNMNAPELADAFDIGAALINEGLAPGSSVLDTISTSDLFAQNQIAITWSDFSAVPTYQEADIEFGMAPFFVVEGQDDFVDTWTAPWGTFTDSPHPDDALLLLEFIATEGQRIQMQATADPPLSTEVAEEQGFGEDDPVKQEFLGVLENARALVFAPPGEENWDPVEVMRRLTVDGDPAAQPILDEMAALAQERLDEVWARWETLDRSQFEDQVEEEQAEASPEE
ncbi:MAG: extracellular solute-binding protein [Chloroflexota bacterium]|nr:extracellular solute-binding protein [Chloroflexota bacterium]